MSLLAVLGLGLFLGIRHATDADHVVAVSTIVTREQTTRAAMLVGALWGLGHTLTILLVGGAIVVFGLVIPPRVGLSMEMSVAVMLVVLGAINVTGAVRRPRPVWGEAPRGMAAASLRSAGSSALSRAPLAHRLRPLAYRLRPLAYRLRPLAYRLRPLAIGVVHGLAGSAAIALLVLTTIPGTSEAVLYLGVFGAGTVLGMMLLTAAVAAAVTAASRRFASFERWLAGMTGLASIAFGLFIGYEIAFVEGLLRW